MNNRYEHDSIVSAINVQDDAVKQSGNYNTLHDQMRDNFNVLHDQPVSINIQNNATVIKEPSPSSEVYGDFNGLHDQTYATVTHDYTTVTDNLGVENNFVYDKFNVLQDHSYSVDVNSSTLPLVSKDLSTTEVITFDKFIKSHDHNHVTNIHDNVIVNKDPDDEISYNKISVSHDHSYVVNDNATVSKELKTVFDVI